LWTPAQSHYKDCLTGFAATRAEAAKCQKYHDLQATTTFSQWQLRPMVCSAWQIHCPFLIGLTKKLVDVSGNPRERQWIQQRLSLAVTKGNAANILACMQV